MSARENQRFGEYELLEKLGEQGGMGTVYRAKKLGSELVNREVVLKRIRDGSDADWQEVDRFKIEIETVATFDHPNIVPIFDHGSCEGELFYTMPLIPGGSLQRRLRNESQLPQEVAARIIRDVAKAVAYAHGRRVIHRDLKPGNILFNERGDPMVIDFGIAKRIDAQGELTELNKPLGTYAYMAPEQVQRAKEVNATADIFSLGAVLYECLVGRPPYKAGTRLDTAKMLLDPDFVPPVPRDINPDIDRNLEAICLQCLCKDRSRRYQSATALADDLQAYLEDRPSTARPLSRSQRLVWWCRKNRAIAGQLVFTAALLVCLVLLIIFGMYQSGQDARKEAQSATEKAEQSRLDEEQAKQREAETESRRKELEQAYVDLAKSEAAKKRSSKEAEEQRRVAEERLYVNLVGSALSAWNDANPDGFQTAYRAIEEESLLTEKFRQWEWWYLQSLKDTGQDLPNMSHDGELICLAASPGGDRIAYGARGVNQQSDTLHILNWDGRAWGNEQIEEIEAIRDIAFNDFGTQIAVASGDSYVVHLLGDDVSGDWPRQFGKENDYINQIVFSPSGKHLVAGTDKGLFLVIDTRSERLVAQSNDGQAHEGKQEDKEVLSLDTQSIDGITYLVSGESDGKVRLWELSDDGQPSLVRELPLQFDRSVHSVAFHPTERVVAAGGYDGSIVLWNFENDPGQVSVFSEARDAVLALAFNRSGTRLVSAGEDRTIRIWDVAKRERLSHRFGHQGSIYDLAFRHPPKATSVENERFNQPLEQWNDRTFVSASVDGTLRLWDTDNQTPRVLAAEEGYEIEISALAFSHDQRLISGNVEGDLIIWNLREGGRTPLESPEKAAAIIGISVNPQTSQIATLDSLGRLRIRTPSLENELELQIRGKSLAFAADGTRLMVIADNGDLIAFDTKDWRRQIVSATKFERLLFSLDSLFGLMANGSLEPIVEGDDSRGLRWERDLVGDTRSWTAMAPSADRIAIFRAGNLELWATRAKSKILSIRCDASTGQGTSVSAIAMSPDGRLIALGDEQGSIGLWGSPSFSPSANSATAN